MDPIGVPEQYRWITGTPLAGSDSDRPCCDSSSRFDDVTDGVPFADARVKEASGPGFLRLHGRDVSLNQIFHVDVIRNTGSVGSRIIRPDDGKAVTLTECGLKDERDDVRFRLMSSPIDPSAASRQH